MSYRYPVMVVNAHYRVLIAHYTTSFTLKKVKIMPIYKILLTYLRVLGITQVQLSDISGIPLSSLRRYFSGTSEIRTKHFISILNNLGIDLSALIKAKVNNAMDLENEIQKDSLWILYSMLSKNNKKVLIDTLVNSIPATKRKKNIFHIDCLKQID
jgi:transcriptional regulator with XRE-family HTH domain